MVDGVVDLSIAIDSVRPVRHTPVVAIQSIKGGTGRTTVAIALALRWAKKLKQPILLVDADLEAPGISYLFRATNREIRISLEDAVTLAHSESALGSPDTINFVSNKLKDHMVGNEVIVLPLRRDLDELASSGIRPEHLSTPEHPFALADLLSAIAKDCGCAGVVVDVRAGLVPVGVNLGLDPDVAPVLVTSLSDQALQGTGALIHFLTREIRRAGRQPRRPLLIVNRVPSVFQQAGMDDKLLEPLVSNIVKDLLSDTPKEVGANEALLNDPLEVDPITVVRVHRTSGSPGCQSALGRFRRTAAVERLFPESRRRN